MRSTQVSQWPSAIGRVGSEYSTATTQPNLLIWIRRQSATSDKRDRLANAFRHGHARLESLTIQSLAPVFSELTGKILDRFEQAGTIAVQAGELFHQAELAIPFNAAMRPCWLRSAEAGIHFEADWAGAVKPQSYVPVQLQHELPSIDVEMSAFLQKSVKDWLKNRTDGVWSEVAKTIHNRLESTLKRGLRDGLTLKEMTAQIQGTIKGIEEYQAKRIARTETTGGMNFGGHAERTDLGIEHKEWVSTIDARTRGVKRSDRYDHISSNGEIVANKDPFIVSGQKLTYPADGSLGARAGNICNCRCCAVGAWPNSPLKPHAPPLTPVKKPKDWIEPTYQSATLPTSPLPNRPVPSANASDDEFTQYAMLRGMDKEQRSQQTIDRINQVREKLAKANDTLEETRLKLVNGFQKMRDAVAKEKDLRSKRDVELGKKKRSKAVIDKLNEQIDEAWLKVSALRDSYQSQFASNLARGDKANVAIIGNLPHKDMMQWAADAGNWLTRNLSEKHGKTLSFQFDVAPKDRAHYDPVTRTCRMTPEDWTNLYLHEMSHAIEHYGNSQTHDLCKGFLHHRGHVEKAEWIGRGDIFEVGIEDELNKALGRGGVYSGKYYPDATEILSMGIQKLYEDPPSFAKNDPEYFKFIVGIVRGDLL